jgi:hypothetical protein
VTEFGEEELLHHDNHLLDIPNSVFQEMFAIILLEILKEFLDRFSVLEEIESTRNTVLLEIFKEFFLFISLKVLVNIRLDS